MRARAREELEAAVWDHGRALEAARRAGDARALAVYRARAAGLSLAEIGRALGCDRAAVPALARRGALLSGSPRFAPGDGGEGKEVMTNSSESTQRQRGGGGHVMTDSEESTQSRCVRDSCPALAEGDSRLCSAHLWS